MLIHKAFLQQRGVASQWVAVEEVKGVQWVVLFEFTRPSRVQLLERDYCCMSGFVCRAASWPPVPDTLLSALEEESHFL